MTKWEYKVLKRQFAPLKDYYETELDELGKSGWELVSSHTESEEVVEFGKGKIKHFTILHLKRSK